MRKHNGSVEYMEKTARNIVEEVRMIQQSREFELIIVGRGQPHHGVTTYFDNNHTQYPELGPLGSILASSHNAAMSSVLVIKQHDLGQTNEATIPNTSQDRCVNKDYNA